MNDTAKVQNLQFQRDKAHSLGVYEMRESLSGDTRQRYREIQYLRREVRRVDTYFEGQNSAFMVGFVSLASNTK